MRFALLLAALSSVAAMPIPVGPQEEIPLRLEFKKGEREDLRFDLDMKMGLELSSDSFHAKQAMDGKILFTFQNTCKKIREAGYVFEAMFTDLEMDQKVTVGEETMKVAVKGRSVRMEGSDGEAVVDTEKGLNPKLAEPMLKELEGFGVAMDLDMDARGLVKEPKKQRRLPKLLQGVASSGNLYPFVLPEKPVAVGGEWVYENEVSSLGDLKLAGKPIKVPIRYKLERLEGEGAARVAVISTKVDTELKGIEADGKMQGVTGDVTLKIRKLTYKGTGETRFFPAAGRVSTSGIDLALNADMSAESENLGGTMDMKMSLEFKAKIAPAGAKKKREF
jgi:hypothetical protein